MKDNEGTPVGRFTEHYKSKVMSKISQDLRRRSTRSENMLWQELRRKQLNGLKFRRQHPIGSSVLDFYCHELNLAIEIDGAIHDTEDARLHDKTRQQLIELYGVHFLRFTADQVEINLDTILEAIKTFAATQLPKE